MTPKSKPMFSANYGNTYVKSDAVAAIQKLFLEYKGDLLATSASPKETSIGWDWGELGEFDLYTGCLCYLFNHLVDYGNPGWKQLFNSLSELVTYQYPRQHPIFTSNITATAQPSKQQRSQPSPNKSQSGSQTQQSSNASNNIEACFDYIIDANVPLEKRVNMSNKLMGNFDKGAKIKILGQDADVVIDKEDAETFLQRISTSGLLLKVVPVDKKYSNGNKLSEIRVREYYKQN